MALRTVLLKARAGTLAFRVPEPGTVAAGAKVSIFNGSGTKVVDTQNAALAQVGDGDATLSYTLLSDHSLLAANGTNLRAEWSCTVGTTARVFNQTFDVRSSVLYPTLRTAAQLAKYYPELESREFKGVAKQSDLIDRGWEDLDAMLRLRGLDPHLIVDPQPLERVHAALAAARIAVNFQPGASTTRDWPAWANDRRQEADLYLNGCLASLSWYDEDGNLVPTAASQFKDRRRPAWIR